MYNLFTLLYILFTHLYIFILLCIICFVHINYNRKNTFTFFTILRFEGGVGMTLNFTEQSIFYLQTLLETSSDTIAVINREGKVIFWNKVAQRAYNIPQYEIIEKKLSIFSAKKT